MLYVGACMHVVYVWVWGVYARDMYAYSVSAYMHGGECLGSVHVLWCVFTWCVCVCAHECALEHPTGRYGEGWNQEAAEPLFSPLNFDCSNCKAGIYFWDFLRKS